MSYIKGLLKDGNNFVLPVALDAIPVTVNEAYQLANSNTLIPGAWYKISYQPTIREIYYSITGATTLPSEGNLNTNYAQFKADTYFDIYARAVTTGQFEEVSLCFYTLYGRHVGEIYEVAWYIDTLPGTSTKFVHVTRCTDIFKNNSFPYFFPRLQFRCLVSTNLGSISGGAEVIIPCNYYPSLYSSFGSMTFQTKCGWYYNTVGNITSYTLYDCVDENSNNNYVEDGAGPVVIRNSSHNRIRGTGDSSSQKTVAITVNNCEGCRIFGTYTCFYKLQASNAYSYTLASNGKPTWTYYGPFYTRGSDYFETRETSTHFYEVRLTAIDVNCPRITVDYYLRGNCLHHLLINTYYDAPSKAIEKTITREVSLRTTTMCLFRNDKDFISYCYFLYWRSGRSLYAVQYDIEAPYITNHLNAPSTDEGNDLVGFRLANFFLGYNDNDNSFECVFGIWAGSSDRLLSQSGYVIGEVTSDWKPNFGNSKYTFYDRIGG